MARPKARELTVRELEIMQIFWKKGESTASEIRDELAGSGRDLAYTTVATLIRILTGKHFLEQTTTERPFRFRPLRSFEDVSRHLLGDLVRRVFDGSRTQLLVRLIDAGKLTPDERATLQQILKETEP